MLEITDCDFKRLGRTTPIPPAGLHRTSEKKYAAHDVRIRGIFDAIRALMEPPTKPRRRIGY